MKAEVVPSAHSAVATALPLFIIYADSLETDEILHACVKKAGGREGRRGRLGKNLVCNAETDETNIRCDVSVLKAAIYAEISGEHKHGSLVWCLYHWSVLLCLPLATRRKLLQSQSTRRT